MGQQELPTAGQADDEACRDPQKQLDEREQRYRGWENSWTGWRDEGLAVRNGSLLATRLEGKTHKREDKRR